jgi:hypothetical protein
VQCGPVDVEAICVAISHSIMYGLAEVCHACGRGCVCGLVHMAKPCMSVVCVVVVVVAHWFLSFPVTNLAQGGHTPLHDAVLRQDIPSVMLLLEGGADINAQTAVST